METRPVLHPALSEGEFRRWYWLRQELAAFASELGIPAAGGKIELADRIAARLAGREVSAPERRPARIQLDGVLTLDTVIPPGQRSSQALRGFFTAQLGPGFHFDGVMREFIRDGAGRTLGDAVEHWRQSRGRVGRATEVAAQFEYNRFTRQWRAEHPGGSREALLEAWWLCRRAPRS